MAWEHLSIDKPHLAYIILGGFTSLFMLVSLFVKEKLYIGEATVATISGIIFGPIGLNLFNPNSWGNVDQITLECSRIVLVVQCFAVGVELPKQYMTRHWKSVVFLLVPVMTYGWLMTSVFIWWLVPGLDWLQSLACAACVTATDPVLASSVVGKGKFAKRIPKHLRDVLSAESGCNDGMAFPFIYLSLYLIRYRPDATKVFEHWFVLTILYECIFGAFMGCCIGYAGRRAIRWAEGKNIVDRESFLVFYFTLALFCAGAGSILGTDDLLVGFCAGVAFSNDGWFSEKTEESHVSNVIDLLLNLAYFQYFGAIIPWSQFNAPEWGMTPWRLVCIAILVIFFRRIPIMLAITKVVPDFENWREALFAGHFGPIGVGAIYVAILARAELEHGEPTPLAELPPPGTANYNLIELVWPITCFLVITSIVIHGSSIAVFTLGKQINTFTLTMSHTIGSDDGTGFLGRLPRLSRDPSRSRSFRRADLEKDDVSSSSERLPVGVHDGMIQRRPEDAHTTTPRATTIKIADSRPENTVGDGNRRYGGLGRPKEGGAPVFVDRPAPASVDPDEVTEEKPHMSPGATPEEDRSPVQVYQEGSHVVIENEEGDVIDQFKAPESPETALQKPTNITDLKSDGDKLAQKVGLRKMFSKKDADVEKGGDYLSAKDAGPRAPGMDRRQSAQAFICGGNLVIEGEDGEVLRTYKIPKGMRPSGGRMPSFNPLKKETYTQAMGGMGANWWGGRDPTQATAGPSSATQDQDADVAPDQQSAAAMPVVARPGEKLTEEELIRRLVAINPETHQVESKHEKEAHNLGHWYDPFLLKEREDAVAAAAEAGEDSDAQSPHRRAKSEAGPSHEPRPAGIKHSESASRLLLAERLRKLSNAEGWGAGMIRRRSSKSGPGGVYPSTEIEETDAERRRREAALGHSQEDDDDERHVRSSTSKASAPAHRSSDLEETEWEKKRREEALGLRPTIEDSDEGEDAGDDGFLMMKKDKKKARRLTDLAEDPAEGADKPNFGARAEGKKRVSEEDEGPMGENKKQM